MRSTLLWGKFEAYGRIFVRVGVVAGLIFSVLQLFPTGDGQGRLIAQNQPVTLAAMEALFASQPGAPLVLIGQPNVDERKIDNPLVVPNALSFLTYRAWKAQVQGLNAFPEDQWPSNISLLYFSYHIMVGLGTLFIAIAVVAAFLLWRGKLFSSHWMLWILLLALPFPYIANTAGWITAELGRQPWLVFGLMRTADGYSKMVSAGNGMFTLLGFMGMYTVLGILFLFLVRREIEQGPRGRDRIGALNVAPASPPPHLSRDVVTLSKMRGLREKSVFRGPVKAESSGATNERTGFR